LKIKLFAILAMVAGLGLVSAPAFANPGNQGGGQGGCGVGQTTNGCSAQSTSTSDAVAVQLQGQLQLQDQRQGQVAVGLGAGGDSSSVSSAVGGNSDSHATAIGGTASASGGSATGGVASSGGNQFTNTYTDEAQKRNPVNTAIGQGATGSTCRYGPGIGVQTIGYGQSMSLPVFKDRDCSNSVKAATAISVANALAALGDHDAALAYLKKHAP
jgi:hypothetical protein